MILDVIENTPNSVLDYVIHRASMSSAMDTTIQFRVTSKLRRDLERLAKEDRRKLGDYVRLLCESAVESRVIASRPTVTVSRP